MALQLTKEQQDEINAKLKSGELTANSPEIKQIVIDRHREPTLLFAKNFLKDHMKIQGTEIVQESPQFHAELIDLYKNNRFIAIAAPRGHAKSTVTSLFYVLHEALYNRKKNIVLVSASEDMAKKFLRRVKDELEFNKNLIHFFGWQKSDKWSETEIKLNNGTSIFAKGREAQLRGLIDGANRPDLIILDDIEDDELVRSELRRIDLEDWFNGAVLPSLSPTNGQVIVIGTILHEASLLNRLLDNDIYPDFVSRRYAALYTDTVSEETVSLWPERFTKEDLEKKKESYISRGKLPQFYMEYLNNPIPTETATFKKEYFTFFDELPPQHESNLVFEVFVDLGGGSSKQSADPTAMVVLAIDQHNTIYVHDYVNKRLGTDTNLITQELLTLYGKYKPRRFVFEKTVATNMIIQPLKEALIKKNVHINIELVTPNRGSGDRRGNMSDGKFQRIAAMEGAFKLGVIKLRHWQTELMDQLLAFPRATHDDLADALSYGYQYLSRRRFYEEDTETTTQDYEMLYPELGL